MFWVALNIYLSVHFAHQNYNSKSPPVNATIKIPPTLSYKNLTITSDSIIYDGEVVDGMEIYFSQAKCPEEADSYWW